MGTLERDTPQSNSEDNSWQSYHVVSEHWYSDLQFFNDELKFFNKLVDKFFIWLEEQQNIHDAGVVKNKIGQFDNRRALLEQKVSEHLKHIAHIYRNPFAYSGQHYKDEHASLEADICSFLKDFRQLKKDVFRLADQIKSSENDQNTFIHK